MTNGLDWTTLHARIEAARATTSAKLSPDLAAEQQVLEERARRLRARPLASTEEATLELVLFRCGEERFALETRFVQRVSPYPEPVTLPYCPDVFLGVVNHRGRPLPVVSLPRLLGGRERGTAGEGRSAEGASRLVLVVGEEPDDLGLAVTAAEQVVTISAREVLPDAVPAVLRGLDFVRGTALGEVLVLAGDRLLLHPQLVLSP